jgi:hypothetical protein
MVVLDDAGLRQFLRNSGIGGEPGTNLGATESAELNIRKRLDREAEPLIERADGGKEIPGKQEVQDLPRAVRKPEESKRPPVAKYVDVIAQLSPNHDVLVGAGTLEILPARPLQQRRNSRRLLQQRATKAVLALWAGNAGRSLSHFRISEAED